MGKQKYDVMIIGPSTHDENIDYTGAVVHETGGAVYFCVYSAITAGANACAAVKMNPEDTAIYASFTMDEEHRFLLPSSVTTLMRNTYFTADRERRRGECLAQADPILPAEIPAVDCGLYHLAGLTVGDFPNALIEELHTRGKVSADMQGFLRWNENGSLVLRDWEEKKTYLPYFDFLKADAAEAEIMTGLSDRREAAKLLYAWGAKEILISYNTEMLVYDGQEFFTCPVKARNLSGRTGRGDTTFGAYISRRMLGDTIPEALLFATAAVSLKMERPGPLCVPESEIRAYIDSFYTA